MSKNQYETYIGLEVHVQLNTQSKMFCACHARYGDPENTNVCPTCLGLPGALPVLNKLAIKKTILTGIMLECKIPEITKWDRKSYFYPDMPKNYQISQFDMPLCENGNVPIYELAYPKDAQKNIQTPNKKIRLVRIHLEEDVGKSSHLEKKSAIDFNRAGTPLMEIVTEPDINNAEEAVAFLNSLRQILSYGDVSNADMEKGQLRCDVNISVKKTQDKKLGEKIELKNLNSVSAVRRAIKYEQNRQIQALENGEKLIQSTRRWDDNLGETQLMRTKEYAHDYRYLPDPDLLPVRTRKLYAEVLKLKPELPNEKQEKYEKNHDISHYTAGIISSDKQLADFFESGLNIAKKPQRYANWICNNFLSQINKEKINITESPISATQIAELCNYIEDDKITDTQAKEIILPEMFATQKNAIEIIKAKGIKQEKFDPKKLQEILTQLITENPKTVAEIQDGNSKAISFFVGQLMKASKGKANPKDASELVRKKILG